MRELKADKKGRPIRGGGWAAITTTLPLPRPLGGQWHEKAYIP